MPTRRLAVHQSIRELNDRIADQTLECLNRHGILALNIMASPGAGKTSLIERTTKELFPDYRIGMINGETNDALFDVERGGRAGAVTVPIDAGGRCHLEAAMIRDAVDQLSLADLDLLIVENIGNLVCPSSWKLGTHYNVLVASTPEGSDKPYKYPAMYRRVDVLITNKTDLLPYVDFDMDHFRAGVEAVSPGLLSFEMSCRSGEGVTRWIDWLRTMLRRRNKQITTKEVMHARA